MPYQKQNFTNGQTLNAGHLNAIEQGIVDNEDAIAAKLPKSGHGVNKLLGTDENGNVVEKEPSEASEIPNALPNPNALTFTGAVTGTYDGSEPVTINIPFQTGDGETVYTSVYMRVSDGYIQYSVDNATWSNVIAVDELKGDQGEPGADGQPGENGQDGEPGEDGEDGLTPFIGENGNWWIGDTDTGVAAKVSADEYPVKLIENTDSSNKTPLRSLESGTYILKGYFTSYTGGTHSYTFSTGMLVAIVKATDMSYVQIFYPKNNTIQYVEISDTDVVRNDAKLVNMETMSNRVTEISETSDDEHYPSALAVYNAIAGAAEILGYSTRELVFTFDDDTTETLKVVVST